MKFSQVLEKLLDKSNSLPFDPSVLYELSNLEAEEMERLTAIWPTMSVERRRSLMEQLVETAEANFEVNFESVFLWGLRDADSKVRASSIEGLWENEDPRLIKELLYFLEHDSSAAVRAAAAMSLGRFVLLGELEKLALHHQASIYDALQSKILEESEDLKVRRRALESISYVSDETVAALLRAAYEHPSEKMRASAIFGMGRSADIRWGQVVMGELFSTSPAMRYEAARACGELEARDAVSRLAELVDDPDREVQEVTLWALGQIGGDQARRLLESFCQKGDPSVRHLAEEALEVLELMYSHLDFPFHEMDQIDDAEVDPSS